MPGEVNSTLGTAGRNCVVDWYFIWSAWFILKKCNIMCLLVYWSRDILHNASNVTVFSVSSVHGPWSHHQSKGGRSRKSSRHLEFGLRSHRNGDRKGENMLILNVCLMFGRNLNKRPIMFPSNLNMQRPWHEYEHNFQIMYKVGMGHKPPIPEKLSTEGKDFLGHCLESEPKRRWTASMLLDHPFVKVWHGLKPIILHLPHLAPSQAFFPSLNGCVLSVLGLYRWRVNRTLAAAFPFTNWSTTVHHVGKERVEKRAYGWRHMALTEEHYNIISENNCTCGDVVYVPMAWGGNCTYCMKRIGFISCINNIVKLK